MCNDNEGQKMLWTLCQSFGCVRWLSSIMDSFCKPVTMVPRSFLNIFLYFFFSLMGCWLLILVSLWGILSYSPFLVSFFFVFCLLAFSETLSQNLSQSFNSTFTLLTPTKSLLLPLIVSFILLVSWFLFLYRDLLQIRGFLHIHWFWVYQIILFILSLLSNSKSSTPTNRKLAWGFTDFTDGCSAHFPIGSLECKLLFISLGRSHILPYRRILCYVIHCFPDNS